MKNQAFRFALVSSAAMLAAAAVPATAKDYFAGRTITVQVPSGSGGTYHVYEINGVKLL